MRREEINGCTAVSSENREKNKRKSRNNCVDIYFPGISHDPNVC